MNEAAEAKMIEMACNALTIAGQEMGEGDHWPVIKATVARIRKDFEDLQTERDVSEEVRKHYVGMISELEAMHAEASADLKPAFRDAIIKLREIYVANFTPVDDKDLYIDVEKLPAHVKRAQAIISTLEEDDADRA